MFFSFMAISLRESIQTLSNNAMAEMLSGRRRHFTNGKAARVKDYVIITLVG